MNPDFDLYSDTYYQSLNGSFRDGSEIPEPVKSYGSISTFLRGCLVLLLRAGFVLIQLGCIPIENVYIIILQNVMDIAISIMSFGLVGFIVAFGNESYGGIIGHSNWILSTSGDLDNAIVGFSACLIATGIITTILSGRIHFVGYFFINILFSMLIQPLIMHWSWHEHGWMRRQDFVGHKVSLKDHAGGLTIHVTAGVVGFIGAIFLGRRLLRLSDIDKSSIGAESPGSTMIGYMFVALGLIGFSLPSPTYELTHIPNNYIAVVLINNIMAMASGIIVVVILQFLFFREPFNYWVILRCLQGAIAGIVSVSSGVDIYTPLFAYIIGSGSSVVFYFIMLCIHNTSVEDYCNIIAIHLACGILSTILPPIFGTSEHLGTSVTAHFRIIHLGWQLVSLCTIIGILTVAFSLLYLMLLLTGFLRNKSEEINHRRAETVAVKGPERCCLQRLFVLDTGIPYIEPGMHGKPPEQYQSYESDNYTSRESPQTNVKYGKTTAVQVKAASEVPDTEKDFDTIFKKNLETNKSSKNIFTMSAVINNPFERVAKYDYPDCYSWGDTVINHENQNPKAALRQERDFDTKSDERPMERQTSCYELHRTRKHTNLARNKRMSRRCITLALQDSPKINLPRSPECIRYDNLFADDFMTIKMPNTKDISFSDASDS